MGVDVVKVTPLSTKIVHRIIERSWLFHYREFMPLRALLPYAGPPLFTHISKLLISKNGQGYLTLEGRIPIAAMTTVRRLAFLEIDDLFVLPSFTGFGAGLLLLETAKEQSSGVPIRLQAMSKNYKARRFYERHGFKLRSEKTEKCWSAEVFPVVTYEWKQSHGN